MNTAFTRRHVLAFAALAAVGACTIDPPDLVLQIQATPIPGDVPRAEIRVLAGNGVVFHGIVPQGEPIVAQGEGVLFAGSIVAGNEDRGLPRRLVGAFNLSDPAQPGEPALRVAVDEPLNGPLRWTRDMKDWTFVGTRRGAEIRRKRP